LFVTLHNDFKWLTKQSLVSYDILGINSELNRVFQS
jgi:hypothetical protein